jgi:hypothetical protein
MNNMNMNPMGNMPFMNGGMPQMNPMMMMGNNPIFQQVHKYAYIFDLKKRNIFTNKHF